MMEPVEFQIKPVSKAVTESLEKENIENELSRLKAQYPALGMIEVKDRPIEINPLDVI